ncbi:uncharacterized protein LOC123266358 [Cotesia glomerata]|uniref:uncharacterized protein LOC123266358 n=1 Tax=Cotesia glomerata TaxID=32391 RepID=UPI001D01A3C2|nr:uncharacterized protein LOC123266358 [Cotesia glomerata]
MLPLSQHSTASTASTQSNSSTTSDFSNELPLEPKLKKIKLMTPEVVSAMDRANVTSRQATHLIFAIASALGHNLNDVSISHRTVHRNRIELRKEIAKDLKTDLRIAQCVVIHWDGKLLPDITGRDKVERLPIILSGVNTQQLLGVPKLDRGTGLNQAIAIKEIINEWNILDRIKAMCFDTCPTNTGSDKGTCSRLEQMLKKPLLYLACRHHIYELILRSVVEVVWPGSNSPNVPIFVRFQNSWKNIDQTKYETGIQDSIINKEVHGKKDEIISFIVTELQKKHDRDDYKELLELVLIFLGGTPKNGIKFRAPGPNHHARWMAKALYALKIFIFKKQFKVNATEVNGLRYVFLFLVNFYTVSWFNAPSAIKSSYQDLNLIKNLYEFRSVHKKMSEAATVTFSRHLWYLSEELVGLALFDDRVSLHAKRQTVTAIKTRESNASNSKKFIVKDVSLLLSKNIEDFASKQSLFLFEQYQLPYQFMDKDPELWAFDQDYLHCKSVFSDLKVVNDLAERGVALIQDYNNCLTRNEEQKQYLLQVVEEHRKKFPYVTKNKIVATYSKK